MDEQRQHGADGVSESATSEEGSSRSLNVLLVEDDRSLRRYLEVVLRKAEYTVCDAEDGLQAIRTLLTAPVDIMITDAIMPNLNGHDLVKFVRTTPSLAQLPVILLSALEDQESRDPNFAADVYLSKPVAPEDLIDWIKKLTEIRSTSDAGIH